MAAPQQKLITVVTATFNRASLLTDLYDSLCRQTHLLFDWIVIDDGSADGTSDMVQEWIRKQPPFHIKLIQKENEGKNRAINDAVKIVSTRYTMIVDSDDYLTDDAIAFLSNAAQEVEENEGIAGVAGLRGRDLSTPLDNPSFPKNAHVVASNLERKQYHLEHDACEVYKTAILASHPFLVWRTEKFVPEQVVWNQLALEGYRLRWYNRITVIVRYQASGMTNAAWNLLKNNPMGYAMMFNHLLLTTHSFHSMINNTLQFISCCFLGNNPSYIFNCNQRLLGILLLLPGWALSKRRRVQFHRFRER